MTTLRDRLDPRVRALEAARVEDGVAYRVQYNHTAAQRWATGACPSGPDRQFGACRADRGVVVQNRTRRTHVLAVAYDLSVATPDGEATVTVVVSPVRGAL